MQIVDKGYIVSGTTTSFGSSTDDVTIQLIENGTSEPAYETIVKGNSASYSISNVKSGTYESDEEKPRSTRVHSNGRQE